MRRAVSAGVVLAIAAVVAVLVLLGLRAFLKLIFTDGGPVSNLVFFLHLVTILSPATTIGVSTVSTFMAGFGLWYAIDPDAGETLSGATIGAVSAVTSHLLFGPVFSLGVLIHHIFSGGSILPSDPITIVKILDGVVAMFLVPVVASLFSGLLAGWLTIPLGALTGWVLVTFDSHVGLFRGDGAVTDR